MNLSHLITAVCVFLVAGPLAGCKPATSNIGEACTMVKRDPNSTPSTSGDYRSVPMTEGELPAGKDFLSFGSTDCEDLVCARDQDVLSPTNPPANKKPTDVAYGYCTRPCAPGNNNDCAISSQAARTFDPRPMTCRPMLLDPSTIAVLCNTDPVKCQEIFGSNRTPYYCARSGPLVPGVDAGTY